MTAGIDWMARAVESEVAYSVAKGGVATDHGDFIYVHNPLVPWLGDYTRAVGVRAADRAAFLETARRVEDLNRERKLARADCYDTYPTVEGDDWLDDFGDTEYRVSPKVFLRLEVCARSLPRRFTWRQLEEDEYLCWRHEQTKSFDWFDEDEWQRGLPTERSFIRVYRPFWLLEDGELVAWVHCANLGGYFRLFDVEVDEPRRGRGYGRHLLTAVAAEAASQGVPHVLIRCTERLRGYYETCGFAECCRSTVIRLRRE
jgi:GNAT superfamily N-acetyltransferase